MVSRRNFMLASAVSAAGATSCRKKVSGYAGFAFIANQEGQAVAAVDLESFTVARHIHLDAKPSHIVANLRAGRVFALTPETGTVHEIHTETLAFARKLQVAHSAVDMRLARDGSTLFVLCSEPKAVISIATDTLKPVSETQLAAIPASLDVADDGNYIGVGYGAERAVSIIRAGDRRTAGMIRAQGEVGTVHFRGDSKVLITADLTRRMLTLYDVAERTAVVDLPLAVRPDRLCFTQDGGQLFVTGDGAEAVVIVFPYYTPEVAETVPAGHSPGAMATSAVPAYLFVANPKSGDVSILDIESRKVVSVTPAGTDPNYIAVTPDSNYALVLNEISGDMAVIRIQSIVRAVGERWRSRRGALFMMIPVGSKPVSAAVTPI